MKASFVNAISDIDARQWNVLCGTDYPFLRHEFLSALEQSGSVGAATGWLPQHVLLHDGNTLVAVMPLYIKRHSYGEYVFDWSWADAYQRHGLAYYPKLVSAIPFTPITGPRYGALGGVSRDAVRAALHEAVATHAERIGASSWHLLFPDEQEHAAWTALGLTARRAVHFQWFNRGYAAMDDFVAAFNSRKRKNLLKERRRLSEAGVSFERLTGAQITPQVWAHFYRCYQLTYARRSGHGGYLSDAFFLQLGASMPEQLMLVLARQHGEVIASALTLQSGDTLYGRYWGAQREIDGLHFETCYYQGIEYCIEHKLARFDPGVQGEHKIQRGFEPVFTYSSHLIRHAGFRAAIEDFIARENLHLEHYRDEARTLLPFRQDDCGAGAV
jgi:predicted N-acyltransferase